MHYDSLGSMLRESVAQNSYIIGVIGCPDLAGTLPF